MTRARILFVDDDAQLLESLQDVFRKERHRWDMAFAQSGAQALTDMARAPCDVVVSDMRMPGMDGAEFLARVKQAYPTAARIVLSGHAEERAVLRAARVAHQYLSKPCNFATLRTTIERAVALQELLCSTPLRAIVGDVERLPSPPRTYLALSEMASDPSKGLADLAAVVENDPAISVKVLQLANSSFFGITRPIASIQQAVTFLGVELLKGLVLSAHVFGVFDGRPTGGFSIDDFQRHSFLTAHLAKSFLGRTKGAEEAFTVGLVHDIGGMVLALELPRKRSEVALRAESSREAPHLVERVVLGVTHAEIGAYLLGVWGLPQSVVEAVAHHHEPARAIDGPLDVLAALHVAASIVDCDGSDVDPRSRIDMEFLERAGFAVEVPSWLELARAVLIAESARPESPR